LPINNLSEWFIYLFWLSFFMPHASHSHKVKGRIHVKKDGHLVYDAEHADGYLHLAKGLMFRDVKPLLLDFPWSGNWGVWMLFMRGNIDLVFVGKDMRVDSVYKSIEPITFSKSSWRVYYPNSPVKYALEVPPGTRIKKGDFLEFQVPVHSH